MASRKQPVAPAAVQLSRVDIPPGEIKQSLYTNRRLQYWEDFASKLNRWHWIRGYYQQRLAELFSFSVPPGMRVLELGCGQGDLLAALKPSHGVGLDLSPKMIARAQKRHPGLEFHSGDAHFLNLDRKFDYIVCSDLVNDVWDAQQILEVAARHSHPSTRLLLNSYSRVWELPRGIGEMLGLVPRQLRQNWFTTEDLENLLYLSGFESIKVSPEVLCPVRIPLLAAFANKFLVKVWPFRWLALTYMLTARPRPQAPATPEPIVTVVVPARNEAGNIRNILERVPQMGAGTELIFVEGNSTDDTLATIEREIARYPHIDAKLFKQPGKGKGDAVRVGFREASGDVLMILDADLTVAPEALPRFYDALRSNNAEFVNGVRLVYPMEDSAMRFLNHIGNRFFSLAFSWLLGQSIKDTLCGTKVLTKRNYETIAANRAYFGEIDPFGDFDLIFGAAKNTLKIVDMPVRYQERTYGDTNIQRWSHGMLLLRMVVKAMRKIKFV